MSGTLNEYRLLVHKACNSQLTAIQGSPFFCEICSSTVRPDEIAELDNSPSPFSG